MRPAALSTLRGEHAHAMAKLAATDTRARCLRFALLQRFNSLLLKLMPLVHTAHAAHAEETEGEAGADGPAAARTLGGRLCQLRGLLFFDAKLKYLQRVLSATATDADAPSVLLNRLRAVGRHREGASAAASATSGEHSVFAQLHEQLGRLRPQALCRHDKACRVNFVGEAADDHGGPYREAIAHICTELQSDCLPLFIRCPNGVHGVGTNRDAYLPSPSATSPQVRDGSQMSNAQACAQTRPLCARRSNAATQGHNAFAHARGLSFHRRPLLPAAGHHTWLRTRHAAGAREYMPPYVACAAHARWRRPGRVRRACDPLRTAWSALPGGTQPRARVHALSRPSRCADFRIACQSSSTPG
eukprot:153209-Pleurochrysis_carterae.AAC.2